MSAGTLLLSACIAMPAAALEPAEVKLGNSGLRMIPSILIKQGYDDNVFATQSDKQSSGKLEIIPELNFIANRHDSAYSFGLALNSATYYSVDFIDYVNWNINGAINEVFNSRNRLDVTLEVGTYTEDKSFEGQSSLPEYDGIDAGILYGFGAKSARLSFDIYADYFDKSYDSANQSKSTEDIKIGGTGYIRVATATKALLEIRSSDIAYVNDSTSDVEVSTAYIGVTWDATAKTTGFVKVGAQNQSRVNGDDKTDLSWEVGVTWEPRTYSSFEFSTEQAFGLDSQSGDYSFYTEVGAAWTHGWTPLFDTKLGARYKDEDLLAGTTTALPVGTNYLSREFVEVGLDLTYDLNRWSELTGGYTYSDRSASDAKLAGRPNINDIYTRNYFYIGIELSL